MIGPALKERREALGLNLQQAAKQANVARSYLYQVERGESQPTIEKVQRLAAAYGTTVGALLGEMPENAQSAYITKARRIIERAAFDLCELQEEQANGK